MGFGEVPDFDFDGGPVLWVADHAGLGRRCAREGEESVVGAGCGGSVEGGSEVGELMVEGEAAEVGSVDYDGLCGDWGAFEWWILLFLAGAEGKVGGFLEAVGDGEEFLVVEGFADEGDAEG